MKTKHIVYILLAIAAIIFVVYLFNMFQLRMERSFGKFVTWTLILLIVFASGWLLGRFGNRKKAEK